MAMALKRLATDVVARLPGPMRGLAAKAKKDKGKQKGAKSNEVIGDDEAPMERDEVKSRMQAAVDNYHAELAKMRTGRASPAMLEPLFVESQGTKVPMRAVGHISALDAATLCVDLYDTQNADGVVKAIYDSDLGLGAQKQGERVVVPVPKLTEERREQLLKAVKKDAESARMWVRKARREALDSVKRAGLPQDDAKRKEKEIQGIHDDHIKEIDRLCSDKEATLKSSV